MYISDGCVNNFKIHLPILSNIVANIVLVWYNIENRGRFLIHLIANLCVKNIYGFLYPNFFSNVRTIIAVFYTINIISESWGCSGFDFWRYRAVSIPKGVLRKNSKLNLNAENNNFELAAA